MHLEEQAKVMDSALNVLVLFIFELFLENVKNY